MKQGNRVLARSEANKWRVSLEGEFVDAPIVHDWISGTPGQFGGSAQVV